MFEELGYYGAGLGAVAKKAGVSRQAIYLHFPSKVELLTALHLHIFDTDVVPVLERHPITDDMTALDALDASIAADVEVDLQACGASTRPSPRPDGSIRRSRRRCARARTSVTASCSTSRAVSSERVSCRGTVRAGTFADMLWGLVSVGTYTSLVNERGWSLERVRKLGA